MVIANATRFASPDRNADSRMNFLDCSSTTPFRFFFTRTSFVFRNRRSEFLSIVSVRLPRTRSSSSVRSVHFSIRAGRDIALNGMFISPRRFIFHVPIFPSSTLMCLPQALRRIYPRSRYQARGLNFADSTHLICLAVSDTFHRFISLIKPETTISYLAVLLRIFPAPRSPAISCPLMRAPVGPHPAFSKQQLLISQRYAQPQLGHVYHLTVSS